VAERALEPVAGAEAGGTHPGDFYPSLQVFPSVCVLRVNPVTSGLRKDL
jgi:hypothetical protein